MSLGQYKHIVLFLKNLLDQDGLSDLLAEIELIHYICILINYCNDSSSCTINLCQLLTYQCGKVTK